MHIYVLPPIHLLLVFRKHHEQAGIFLGQMSLPFEVHPLFGPTARQYVLERLRDWRQRGVPQLSARKPSRGVVREVLQTKWPKKLVKLELERFFIFQCVFSYMKMMILQLITLDYCRVKHFTGFFVYI